ncbi:VWA domain-containing protein [Kineobactrum salinum]|uniref:VWA domain-containing protein n=1 Tax=Kineobactrum salinum TaxID=2708301 RepID=A0A6C0U667_9GAMM|nr:VWA domain-containing protein [Kineobactrum salinum]QIB66427.1 VWA domain-containing protein [Kineobactrum salinum]
MARSPARTATSGQVQAFLSKSRALTTFSDKHPRLIFAVDATASRQPTWDVARRLQADMFRATRQIASLSVQLCYYRGFHEFHASPWLRNTDDLAAEMARVHCEGGHTQIGRLLRHALQLHRETPARALVFIGDALEELPDDLCDLAGQCGLRQLPLFLFQEGGNAQVRQTFQSMARLSGGAWARFDQSSADTLAQLLGAVARFAAGGRAALENNPSEGARLLLQQLKP